jgi:hypothetical protein
MGLRRAIRMAIASSASMQNTVTENPRLQKKMALIKKKYGADVRYFVRKEGADVRYYVKKTALMLDTL